MKSTPDFKISRQERHTDNHIKNCSIFPLGKSYFFIQEKEGFWQTLITDLG